MTILDLELIKICASDYLKYGSERLQLKLKQSTLNDIPISGNSATLFFLLSVNVPAVEGQSISFSSSLNDNKVFQFETFDFETVHEIETLHFEPFCLCDQINCNAATKATLLYYEITTI